MPYMFEICSKMLQRIIKIQRAVKVYLRRRKFAYAFNCRKWVLLEVEILRETRRATTNLDVRVDQVTHQEAASMT